MIDTASLGGSGRRLGTFATNEGDLSTDLEPDQLSNLKEEIDIDFVCSASAGIPCANLTGFNVTQFSRD
jgi:hypothetical protein